ncbi:uncharacterized protein LOC111134568 isoform X4 [Crassostrea virginica]|uniref:Protein naked cuticle homolog n=1 Tax=Crassostrea virginica TaxID=6565 RepID=A0A8B8EIY5_CRAVI|nr:protein naked cuticle homolog 2-like isoform X3 [Crassostrea virginica]
MRASPKRLFGRGAKGRILGFRKVLDELSVSLENKGGNIPLRVELPPQKMDTENPKVLELGQDMEKPQLSIEEFECGVQFEGLEKNKQEWSFTLYDFDGHGKITREDLSSLLKALYDAVGSSIKIPSNGTKTLKLRLTVGQDNTQIPENKSSPTKGKKDKPSKDSDKVKDSPKVKDTPKSKEFAKLNNNLTATHVQLPAKQCNSDLQERVKGQCQNSCQVKGHNLCTAQGQDYLCSGSKRIQLTTQERQQLVELVQENMERNHVKQLRRHHSDCRGTTTHDHSHHKRRHRVATCNNQTSNNITAPATTSTSNNNNNNTIQEERAKECQDRRNYYLDLAGIEHNAKTQVSQNLNNSAGQSVWTTEHPPRSKSQDTKKCDNLQRESQRIKQQHLDSVKVEHLRSRSFDPQEVETRSPKGHHKGSPHKHGRFRPVSLPVHVPDSLSHHHRRHRHRDKDHDLAMQQVAEWIEREHACDIDGDKIVVQKHEHHHIHEHHHHHHYHHYYEA